MKLFKQLRFSLVIAISIVAAFIASSYPANASGGTSIAITGGPGINICSSTLFSVPISAHSSVPYSDRASMSVPGVGNVFSFSENDPAGSGSSYGFSPSGYSVAPNTPITISITAYNAPNQSGGIASASTAIINCSTGALLSATGGGSIGGPGPGIPSGFVLHTITCTVAVFTTAGGTPLSNATILAGQTWFVSPTSVKDGQGKLWTQIFAGGPIDGFIPTSCVQ